MIITRLKDGLGNQLFQYAFGRYLANKHNAELKLDITECENKKTSHHEYYKLNEYNIQENFATSEDIQNCKIFEENRQKYSGAFLPDYLNLPDNIILKGWWQSESFFSPIADIIRNELTLKNPLHEISAKWEKKILSAKNSVSLHIRRGDYLTPNLRYGHGMVSIEYYKNCLSKLKKIAPQITVFVFSDDMEYVKNNLNFNMPTEFVEGCESDIEELYLMSLCTHNIIANSSFSWWGAWLNRNPDKKVFAPKPWFFHDPWGSDTLVPDSWIEMSAQYEKSISKIVPTFSVIIYVENSLNTINYSLSSFDSNNPGEYEVILIDTSTDGTKNFCRQFKSRDNFTYLRVDKSVGKIEAWNLGLNHTRGHYILFLTAKDIDVFLLLPGSILAKKFTGQNFKDNNQKYSIYEDFVLHEGSNIICSTKWIEEDDNGTLNVRNIPNKKFSIKVDSRFKDLNSVAEISINDRNKIMLLATQQINNLLGTKFFKRNFLNENKIRFDENLNGESAELKFLMDAFIHTENIMFTPQLFYGILK